MLDIVYHDLAGNGIGISNIFYLTTCLDGLVQVFIYPVVKVQIYMESPGDA